MRRSLTAGERGVLVAVVVAVACLLRVGFVLKTHALYPILADAEHYDQYARNLHEHGVFSLDHRPQPQPDSFRSPGYPVFLLLHRAAFGAANLYDAARLGQALLDSLTVLLAYLLARRLLPFPGALAVAALTALSPHLIANTGFLQTETVTTFALTLALLALQRAVDGGARGLLCGAAFAAATLTNEALTPLPFLLVWLAWRSTPGARPGARRALLTVVAVCAVAHAAWAVRNGVSVGADAPRGSQRALQTVSHGTYPDFVFRNPRYRYMPYRDDPEQPRYGEDLGHFARVFTQRVAERPLRYLSWYALEKPFHLWGFDGLQATREIYTYPTRESLYDGYAAAKLTLTAMRLLHWPLVALGLLGVIAVCRKLRDQASASVQLRLLSACLGYGTLLGIVFAPWPRYVIPLRPVLFVLAMFGAMRVAQLCRRREPDAVALGAATPS